MQLKKFNSPFHVFRKLVESQNSHTIVSDYEAHVPFTQQFIYV